MKSLSERSSRRPLVYVAALALAAAGAVSAFAWANGSGAAQGMALDAAANPADFADHVAQMSEHIYAKVGATDAQKARLDPLFAQAAEDFAALHAAPGSGHDQLADLLAQDPIDRAKLENLRAEHMRNADDASRRLVQLLADVAEVLTPAQRKLLAEGIKAHHGGHMGWHHG